MINNGMYSAYYKRAKRSLAKFFGLRSTERLIHPEVVIDNSVITDMDYTKLEYEKGEDIFAKEKMGIERECIIRQIMEISGCDRKSAEVVYKLGKGDIMKALTLYEMGFGDDGDVNV